MSDNRKRALIFGALALLLAFFTVRAVSQRLRGEDLAPVVVALQLIPAGSQITPDMLQVVQRPRKQWLDSYFETPEKVIGQTTLVSIASGDLLRAEVLDPDGCPIPQDMALVTLSATQAAFPGGLIDCRSYVDVFFARRDEAGSEQVWLFHENLLVARGCARLLSDEPAENAQGDSVCHTIELLIPPDKQAEWSDQMIYGEGVVLGLLPPATPADEQAIAPTGLAPTGTADKEVNDGQ